MTITCGKNLKWTMIRSGRNPFSSLCSRLAGAPGFLPSEPIVRTRLKSQIRTIPAVRSHRSSSQLGLLSQHRCAGHRPHGSNAGILSDAGCRHKVLQHLGRTNHLFVVVFQALVLRDVADGMKRVLADFARSFRNLVGHGYRVFTGSVSYCSERRFGSRSSHRYSRPRPPGRDSG